ncbi:redoxin family protein [Pendulispora albinea]|uniref:Redoxin family protein n=1 Tax=Pendulispora albinea TaxID=2741071 RepID=A0ABZ2LR49_9BACT
MRTAQANRFGRFGAAVLSMTLAACAQTPPAPSVAAEPSPQPAKLTAARTETPSPRASAEESLQGDKPPEWQPTRWLNSPPLRLAELRGKVVLVRWWTAGCPFCSASAPALRRFHAEYGPKGLVVVGMYHHKDEGAFEPRVYEDTAKRYGFTFPLAFDPEWRTLKSWLHGVDTGWTSVTFVLDKEGTVRHVHPGGQYVEGDPAHAKLRTVVEQLLAENDRR